MIQQFAFKYLKNCEMRNSPSPPHWSIGPNSLQGERYWDQCKKSLL